MLIKFVRVPDIRLEISTCRVYDSDSRCRTMEEEVEEGEKRKNSMKIEGGREKKIAGKSVSIRARDRRFSRNRILDYKTFTPSTAAGTNLKRSPETSRISVRAWKRRERKRR